MGGYNDTSKTPQVPPISENPLWTRKPPQAQVFCHNMLILLAGSLGTEPRSASGRKNPGEKAYQHSKPNVAIPRKWGPWFCVGHVLIKPLAGTTCSQCQGVVGVPGATSCFQPGAVEQGHRQCPQRTQESAGHAPTHLSQCCTPAQCLSHC